MTKSKLERLVDYATELCGELDAPGYLAMATGASILKTSPDIEEMEGSAYECIYDMLKIIDHEIVSINIMSGLIGRFIYESNQSVPFLRENMHDPSLASIRGALNKKVMDNV